MTEQQQKSLNPTQLAIRDARRELQSMEAQFLRALPAHIPAERFARVVMTAIQNDADLVTKCSRQSLWNAAMRAAQDGLLPDGRDGAIVRYGDQAQWMPMIGGLRKKARNSGVLANWEAHVVYSNDQFDYELGDEPYIKHKPALKERGEIVAAYSVATFKDGTKSREVMNKEELDSIKAKSKAKGGPWKDPAFVPEMYKKVVARRHSKVLPMSTDLDDLIRRDDHLYDLDAKREPNKVKGLTHALDQLAGTATPVDDLPANAPDLSGDAGSIIDAEAVDKTSDQAREEAVPSPAEEPEEFLKFLDEALPRMKSLSDIEDFWSKHIAESPGKIFPSDLDEIASRVNKRREELKA